MQNKTPIDINNQLQSIGFSRRLGALLYDMLLLFSVLFFAAAIALAVNGGQQIPPGSWWYRVYLYLAGFLFFGYFWTAKGQTLGMRAWRLVIVQTDHTAITWQQAAVRYLAATLSLGAFGLGYLWAIVDKDKLTWHDTFSNTRLLMKPR